MRVRNRVRCSTFPCKDVNAGAYVVPSIDLKPGDVSVVMISEAAPPSPRDYYYASGKALFAETTILAFQDAGARVESIKDILELGFYLTTAVKCAKVGYGLAASTVGECSLLLEKELALFPDVKAFLLMGDVAIQAFNQIARRRKEPRVIPAGSTYKIRGGRFSYHGARVFPSYLQAGPSFFIEKSKRKMIAQDIAAALSIVS